VDLHQAVDAGQVFERSTEVEGRERLVADLTDGDVCPEGRESEIRSRGRWYDFAPGAPVIFGMVGPDKAQSLDLPPDVRGVVSRFDARGTVDLARQLQPEAERIVVVTGSSPFDRSWETTARAALTYDDGIEVDFVSDMSVAGFAEMAAGLDRDAILLILTVYEDAEGHTSIPRDAATIIAAASAAPAYGVYSTRSGKSGISCRIRWRASCTFFSTCPFSQPAAGLQNSGSKR
jgi:hypothetical protein